MNAEQPADVVALSRPPIVQSTTVRSDVAHTFETFVRTIDQWWPLRPYSVGQARVVSVTFEERAGGRVYETWDDGTEVTWGRVTGWDPPNRFTMTWEILPEVTEVELLFKALGPALTRVQVTHSGWERLRADDLEAATAVPGGYAAGWLTVLTAFAESFD